jgi:hypothetical protein
MADDLVIQPAAAADLEVPGAPPAAPVVPMSVAEGLSRKQEFLANKEKMAALMNGGVRESDEWRMIVSAISAQPPAATAPRDQVTEDLNAASGYSLPAEVLQEYRENRPVTPDEYRIARARLDSRIQDPDWRAKYGRGDLEAKKEMALIQSILSRPIRDPQSQS